MMDKHRLRLVVVAVVALGVCGFGLFLLSVAKKIGAPATSSGNAPSSGSLTTSTQPAGSSHAGSWGKPPQYAEDPAQGRGVPAGSAGTPGHWSGGSGGAGFQPPALPVHEESRGVAQDTKEQLAARLAESKRDLENLQAESRAWLEGYIKNPHLASNTREVYRLRLLKDYRAGHQALRDGDYILAYNLFAASLTDPNASPVSRYLALDYMRAAAAKAKDIGRYCEALRMQGAMLGQEDLSVLGLEKDPHGKEMAEETIRFLKAAKDPRIFESLVDELLKNGPKDMTRQEAEDEIRAEIALREEIFND